MKKTLTTILSTLILSISSLYAHPGPVGHTHGNERSFGIIIALVLSAIIAGVMLTKLRKN